MAAAACKYCSATWGWFTNPWCFVDLALPGIEVLIVDIKSLILRSLKWQVSSLTPSMPVLYATHSLLCTKQLSWKIFMSSLNQHDTVKVMCHQLPCTFGRTKPTVSYYSMPTAMIWLSQSDSGCCCCPKRLNKFLG